MRTKSKSLSQLIETRAYSILESRLPDECTLRSFHPDYGIDFDLEIFEQDPEGALFSTLGEHLFLQVKENR